MMTSYIVCVVSVLIIQICLASEDLPKSSLTFVIDDTGSMWNEIDQVKREANNIFDTVLRSNTSQIEDFILVTFNDPDVILRVLTKDRDDFKRALDRIHVDGGGDCPEYAMQGIEIALRESLPLSYLYVFTDASAKDHTRFEHIKALSQTKQSQIVFVLTGDCGTETSPEYKVYQKVAQATNGQVFHMMKDDIKDILRYVEETITSRGVTVVNTIVPPGSEIVEWPIDSHTKETIISITGKNPKIGEVTGPDGSKPHIEHLSEKERLAMAKVTGAKPGVHEVEIGSRSETHVVITAKTSVNFRLGFSIFRPTSFKDVVTRPGPDGNTYLSVKLIGEGVKLNMAKVLDMSDNVIMELPLELLDEKEQFYVTLSFAPPNTMFRVAVFGIDEITGTPITRTAPTPIERQDPRFTETIKNMAPEISIEGAPSTVIEYDSPAQLKCWVQGYPAPDIYWEEKDSGVKLAAKVSLVEVPYKYISILDIEKVTKNVTYQCKASNTYGVNIKYIFVEAHRTQYFNVIETPKDIGIEYTKEGKLVCNIDAYPPPTITWYKNRKVFSGDKNIELSSNNTILTIKNMVPELEGRYVCEVRNELERRVYHSDVEIFGLEMPKIDKSVDDIRVKEKTDAELSCRIIEGIPKPLIRWSFRRPDQKKFRYLMETGETLHLKDVGLNQTGSYKCLAQSIAGADRFTMVLIVEYPPKLKKTAMVLRVKDGNEVRIPCDVTGEPVPTVEWYLNGTRVIDSDKTRIAADNSLKFKATLSDTGFYTCEADNPLGSAKQVIYVDVIIPVNIDIPKATTIEAMVGKNVLLPCRADGYPKPEIKWSYLSPDAKPPPKDVTPTDGTVSMTLRNVQLDQQGYYTCVADNGVSTPTNITYELKVYAPPIIENVYKDKTFQAVEGDTSLKIQCKAKGSPTPTIVWKKNGLNLAIGSEWYGMEGDYLVIKNIDTESGGTYVCVAENKLGNDTEMYEVIVRDTPILERPTSTVFLKEGDTIDIKCEVPHEVTDTLRWFKDGLAVANEELTLYKVGIKDAGIYTCRVSGIDRSQSASTKVVVGFKPKFYFPAEETIDWVEGADIELLDCEADGEPKPKEAIWKHNGKSLSHTYMTYPLEMTFNATGIYECEVSNEFGSIHRQFRVKSRDCILNIKKDFPERQPVMVTRDLTWPDFRMTEDGYMIIPHNTYIFLNCPSKFSSFISSSNAMAFCVEDNKVRINGVTHNFNEINCNEDVKPAVERTGFSCLPGNTEYVQVGFKVHKFIKVYDVCLDKDNNVTLFTRSPISPYHTDSSIKAEWSNMELPQDFESLYDCRRQMYDITAALGRRLPDSCCFGRRQLLSAHDLAPGIPASVTFDYLNVVPQWSSCHSKNWDEVEKRVRELVKPSGRELMVTTGTVSLPTRDRSKDIRLQVGSGGNQPTAQYLWKIVQDPPSKTSIAIIQVNVPGLSASDVSKYVKCLDICHLVDWIDDPNWKNINDGYIYCCKITDFEDAFGYPGRFSPNMNYILYDVPLIPEFYMTKK